MLNLKKPAPQYTVYSSTHVVSKFHFQKRYFE